MRDAAVPQRGGPLSTSTESRVGRPRDPSRDVAIVDAALALLAEGGYAALTMEAVAARAGVGKATVYRRWPSKEQLVVEAVATLVEPPPAPAGAGVREELVTVVEAVRRKAGSLAGQVFPRLMAEGFDNPAFMERYREHVLAPRHRRLVGLLQRAVDEGLVRPDADLDHAVDLLLGPVVYRNLVRTDPPSGPDLAPRVVDDVLRALAPVPQEKP